MNKQTWIEHLSSWKEFLTMLISSTEDLGQRIKYTRQIRTIEKIRCGAALNPDLLLEFINPSNATIADDICKNFFLELNDTQKKAVNRVLGNSNLSLIQGPPGTGKTQVIAEICLQLLANNPNLRILVCSETHVAVNNLLSRISAFNKEIRIVRIRDKENDDSIDSFSPDNIIKSFINWSKDSIDNPIVCNILEEELELSLDNESNRKNQLEKLLILSANIVGMTCNRSASYDFNNSHEMFDVVIIDEVCKATLPEILSPLLISKKAVLLGDPNQLPPVFCSEEQDIITSIQNCNLNKYMYIDSLFLDDKKTVLLNTQYRMTNQIGRMISEVFYNGVLKNGRDVDIENSLIWIPYKPSCKWPISNDNKEITEIYNNDEISVIKKLITNIRKKTTVSSIAVISPYRGQIFRLRKSLSEFKNIKIDTVDGFQGRESEIVIFSVTRTCGSYRFLADPRRLNVALSRAKNQLFIVGELDYARKNPLLEKIIKYCLIQEN